MNSEHKLAMIVGFSLVLAVGILISDHLSRARLAELAALGDNSVSATPVLVQSSPARTQNTSAMNTVLPERQTARDTIAFDIMNAAPVDASPMTASRDTLASVPPASSGAEPRQADIGSLSLGSPQPAIALSEPAQSSFDADVPIGQQISVPTIGMHRISGGPSAEEPTPVAQPERNGRVYHVKPGDSLYSIAKSQLGDGHRWREIQNLNRDRVGRDGSVRVRVALRLPAGASMPASGPIKSPAAPSFASYTVKKGDTLGEISQRLLGTVRRTNELIQFNSDKVKNANSIRPGMVLRYPLGPQA